VPLQDLEEARAILEAKLSGRDVSATTRINADVVSAMTLIADGYNSESEEDGEIEHDQLKQAFIETKIKEIVAEGVLGSTGASPRSGSRGAAGKGAFSGRKFVEQRSDKHSGSRKYGSSSHHDNGIRRSSERMVSSRVESKVRRVSPSSRHEVRRVSPSSRHERYSGRDKSPQRGGSSRRTNHRRESETSSRLSPRRRRKSGSETLTVKTETTSSSPIKR